MFLLIAATACLLAQAPQESLPFGPETFNANEGCHWRLQDMPGLRMNDAFIAGPAPGQDRGAWLEALQRYRDLTRTGRGAPCVVMEFDGVRAWLRLDNLLAKALALAPGDLFQVRVEARWLEGNNELCIALDEIDAVNGVWAGWSGVKATLSIPEDGHWHWIEAALQAPALSKVEHAWRPIVGMDGTHNAAKGKLEIRSVQFRVADEPRNARLVHAAAQVWPAGLDRSNYEREDLKWASGIFACHFTFLYDRSLYDPDKGYNLDAFLEDGQRAFGGYDAVLLWQAYPRIGLDQRNQFDFYRDMPGGLEGLPQEHDLGVNPGAGPAQAAGRLGK